jgi:tetratricopeptide (TPR) repeat protein
MRRAVNRTGCSLCRGFVIVFTMALFLALPNPAHDSSDYAKGLASFRAGDYAQAAEFFRKADAAAPGATDALFMAAKAFVHLEKYPDAESALRSYLAKSPSADALYLLGYVLNREDRPADSLKIYTQAAALQPPAGDDLKIVGLDYVLLDDYPSAIHWLEKAVDVDPKNGEAWYFLGRACYTRSRLSEAKAAFDKALQLNPEDAKAENNLGLIFESEARPADAIQAYKQAIAWQQKSARPSEQPYLNLGSILLDQERNEEALPPLEQAVKLAATNPLCRLKLGIAYLRVQKLDRAQSELEEAARLDPGNAAVHFQLGKLYKQMHALDRAQKEFARAEEIQSRAATATIPKPKE